jgi:hypothetical protein
MLQSCMSKIWAVDRAIQGDVLTQVPLRVADKTPVNSVTYVAVPCCGLAALQYQPSSALPADAAGAGEVRTQPVMPQLGSSYVQP